MIRLAMLLGLVAPLAWCQIKIQAVVNSASYSPGLPNSGGLASIFVSGLRGLPGLYTPSPVEPLPFELVGVSITVDGTLAPILGVYIPRSNENSLALINIQVPLQWTVAGDHSALAVSTALGDSDVLTPISGSAWGGFFAGQAGFALAQHDSDSSFVSSQNPAHPGETIRVYANDFFQVWPPVPVGFPTPMEPSFLRVLPPPYSTGYLFLQSPPYMVVAEGGVGSCANTPAVNITFEGLAPGLVGVELIKFVVPANQPPGDFALFFNTGTDANGNCPPLHGRPSSSPYVELPVR